jgi:hypothetical protein
MWGSETLIRGIWQDIPCRNVIAGQEPCVSNQRGRCSVRVFDSGDGWAELERATLGAGVVDQDSCLMTKALIGDDSMSITGL